MGAREARWVQAAEAASATGPPRHGKRDCPRAALPAKASACQSQKVDWALTRPPYAQPITASASSLPRPTGKPGSQRSIWCSATDSTSCEARSTARTPGQAGGRGCVRAWVGAGVGGAGGGGCKRQAGAHGQRARWVSGRAGGRAGERAGRLRAAHRAHLQSLPGWPARPWSARARRHRPAM